MRQKARQAIVEGFQTRIRGFELHLFLSSTAIASICLGLDLFWGGGGGAEGGTPVLSDHVQLEGGHGHVQ